MQAKRRLSERGMSAFGHGRLLGGMSALAFAASFAYADTVPILSPEAPVSFANLGGSSPLLAICNTGRFPRGLDPASLAEAKFDLASAAQIPPGGGLAPFAAAPGGGPSVPDPPPPGATETPAGPPLSPTQSALKAALERLVARDDKHNPLGSG